MAFKSIEDGRQVTSGPGGVNEADSANEELIRSRVAGDDFDRYVLKADGTTLTGDGTAEPSESATYVPVGTTEREDSAFNVSGAEFKGSSDAGTSGDAAAWFHVSNPLGDGIPVGYIDNGGNIKQQRSFCVSGRTLPTGTRRIVDPTSAFYTIAMWTDGSTGDPELVCRANNDDQPLIQVIEKLGNRRFEIDELGKHHWSPNGTNNGVTVMSDPALDAAHDVTLYRSAAGTLRVEAVTGDSVLGVNAPTGQTPYLRLLRDTTTIVEVSAQASTSQYKTVGTTTFSTYSSSSVPRMAIGGDRSTSTLSVLIVGSAFPGITVKAHASGSADLFQVMDSAEAVYSRFNKAGYFITKKNAAPADADVSAGEMALWFDATNGAAKAMFKAKQADGTVVTAAVAMA